MAQFGNKANKQELLQKMSRENWLFATMVIVSGFAYIFHKHREKKKLQLVNSLLTETNLGQTPKIDGPNIIFIIDAAAGSAHATLMPTLKAVGIFSIDGTSNGLMNLLQDSCSKDTTINDDVLKTTILNMIHLSKALSSYQYLNSKKQTNDKNSPKVAVFLSSIIFRSLGTQILKIFPFSKWVFAYDSGETVFQVCSCISNTEECYPKNDKMFQKFSMRNKNASEFIGINFEKYLNKLPIIQQNKIDVWLGAIDLLFTIKNNEDEDNEINKTNLKNLAQHRLNLWFSKDDSNKEKEENKKYANDAFEIEKQISLNMKLSGGHGFAPFTLRMSFLNANENANENSNRITCLQQLLQFIEYGIPGNDVAEDVIMKALETYNEMIHHHIQKSSSLFSIHHFLFCPISLTNNKKFKKNIQILSELAFEHKRLLLQDKLILDTVTPEVGINWKLRSNRRKGCGCCAPEDDEEDDGEDKLKSMQKNEQSEVVMSSANTSLNMAMPGGFAMAKPKRRRPITTSS